MLKRSCPRASTARVTGKGNVSTNFPRCFPLYKCSSLAQLSSGHGAFHKRTRGAVIAEKSAADKRLVSGLIGHLLPTTGSHNETKRQQNAQPSI